MESVHTRLRGLREAYAAQLPSKVAHLDELWKGLREGKWDAAAARVLHRLSHSLTGSGATLGHPAVSEKARALEQALQPIAETGGDPGAGPRANVDRALEGLRNLLAEPGAGAEEGSIVRPAPAERVDPELIYVVGPEEGLARQLEPFGYRALPVSGLPALGEAVSRERPSVIVLDASRCGLAEAAWALRSVQEPRESPVPVVFVASEDDIVSRLQAVHAGGSAYFTHPVDIGWLVDKLDELSGRTPTEAYRILIVEDEPLLARHNALVLEQAGMVPGVVTDPLAVFETLSEFRPDLILMDMYMPGCTGLELAAVIRQHEDFVSVPIVFLSTEARLDRRMQAMMAGGDDFLIKPARRDYLVSSISARVKRARILRTRMERDSLTRLLNHTHIRAQLDTEIARERRQGGRLSYALIDLDHFKSVNDTHGHRAGDRVLKSLARILQQRFRSTDVVGRYGGEEFVVILPDSDAAVALAALDEVRQTFAELRHRGRGQAFSVSFSAGISEFPRFAGPARLHDAADRALYRAKGEGRNRIAVASRDEPVP